MSKETAFENVIEKVFEGFRKITPALVALFIVTGFIMFSPEGLLVKFGLNVLPHYVRVIIGLIFLLSIALIITILVSNLLKAFNRRKIVWERIKVCRSLNAEQKKIMKRILASKEKTVSFDCTNGNIVFLKSMGLIFAPQQVIGVLELDENRLNYCPQPWVFEVLKKAPGLFD